MRLAFLILMFATVAQEPALASPDDLELELQASMDDEESQESLAEPEPLIDDYSPTELAFYAEPKEPPAPAPIPNWYFTVKPGFYWFTNENTRQFFNNGNFTIRGEAGYTLWGPMALWFDGSYFHQTGHALGGPEDTKMLLSTLSLGLKCTWYPSDRFAIYLGAAPRLYLLMMENDSPYVRSDDNEIGLGAGFQGGFWVFPIPAWKNFYLDLFTDYSWKNMEIEPDEISSDDYDLDISGLSFGIGLGLRF